MTTPDQIEAMARAPWAYSSQDIAQVLRQLAGIEAKPVRVPLPDRRRNVTENVTWIAPNGTAFELAVCVGVDQAGQVYEVFCNHAKGDMAAMLADTCVVISIALQHGITPAALAKSLGTVPGWPANQLAPASPVGTILEAVMAAQVQPMPVADQISNEDTK